MWSFITPTQHISTPPCKHAENESGFSALIDKAPTQLVKQNPDSDLEPSD